MEQLDKKFSEKLSRSLELALGPKITGVVYSVLKSEYGIEKEEVPANPAVLKLVLEKLFGNTGMDFLETLISKQIVAEFNLPAEYEEEELPAILMRARQEIFLD